MENVLKRKSTEISDPNLSYGGWREDKQRSSYTDDIVTNTCTTSISILLKGRKKTERLKVSTHTNLFDENISFFLLDSSIR